MTESSELQEAIERMLATTVEPGSRNTMTALDVRRWCNEYLAEYLTDTANFPGEPLWPHWNLNMADYDLGRDACFVAYVFYENTTTFCCGRGKAYEIRQFCESASGGTATSLIQAIQERFTVPAAPVSVKREVADRWLDNAEAT